MTGGFWSGIMNGPAGASPGANGRPLTSIRGGASLPD